MSLSFTDSDLRTISKQVLDAPTELAQDNDNLSKAIAKKAEFLEKDGANKVFYDNFWNILNSYSEERRWLDGTYYTQYSEATDLIPSARQDNNSPHYPVTPTVWTKLSPKILPSNNGNPVLSMPTGNEAVNHPLLSSAISTLKTGFADGSSSTTTSSVYSPTTVDLTSTVGISVGHRLVISEAGNSVSALVQVLTVSSTAVTYTQIVAPDSSIGIGATVRNYFVGYSNLQRESSSAKPYPEIFDFYTSRIDSRTSELKNSLQNQKLAVDSNPAIGSESTQNTSASGHLASAIGLITDWESKPLTGTGVGKYGDTSLGLLSTMQTDRLSQYPARATQIASSLGSVSQNPDGSYTGAGNYYSLFKWIDLRAGKTGGSLFGFYNTDLIITFLQQKMNMTINKIAEYDATIVVKDLTEDSDGTEAIHVTDITGLSVGSTVKILTDDAGDPVLNLQIIGISGLTIELSAVVPLGYTTSKSARLVRLL